MWFSKYGKYIIASNLTIGLTSLAFQITVLYPWHIEISNDLHHLAKKIKNSPGSPGPSTSATATTGDNGDKK